MTTKKPIPLSFERTLAESDPSTDSIKVLPGSPRKKQRVEHNATSPAPKPPAPGFDCRLRLERKGRGGQPVFVLYAFSEASLQKFPEATAAGLARALKQRLSCGGTHEEVQKGRHEIILQFRDEERLASALGTWGIKAQRSGG